MSRRRLILRPSRTLAWAMLIIAMVITAFPFYWMVRTALTPAAELVADSGQLWPTNPTLINFQRVLGLVSTQEAVAAGGTGASFDFPRFTLNSLVYAGGVALVQTAACAAAAYAFARLHFRGRDTLFLVVIGGLMIPGIFTLLPNFTLIRELQLMNTMTGMMLPAMLMSPFAIFFLRQFFLSMPIEVEEAAMLDGLGPLARFVRIAIPMNVGPIATMVLITFVGMWKDYLWPFVVGRKEHIRPLTVGLSVFLQQSPNTAPDWTGLMAGSTLSVLPALFILIFLGRQLVQSLSFSGNK